jgi:EAL domain-containing protein (putative c-di-GMP-specific phosphodiesterase class I)
MAIRERSLGQLVQQLRDGDGERSLVDLAVAAAREHLDMDVSLLSEFRDGRQVYRHLDGDAVSFGIEADTGPPLAETLCARVVAGTAPAVISDTAAEPAVSHLPLAADIGAYVGVPVRLPDGALYGTLCCLSRDPDPMLRDRDARFVEVLAAILGQELGHRRAELEHRHALRDRVREVIRDGALSMAFQPIVSLADRRLAGVEALARMSIEPYRPPDEWFADAWEGGLGLELELLAARTALGHLERVPAHAYLSINASPETVASEDFAVLLRDCDRARVVIEVTEHAIAAHYDVLAAATRRLRATGVRFAVDDAGAGYAGLSHILRLGPDIVKLDRFLVTGVEHDAAREALAAAAAAFAARSRTQIVAEGVETAGEHARLRELGIGYAQGFHYARPSALDAACAAA